MVLKAEWEKTDRYAPLDATIIQQVIDEACVDQEVLSYEIISGGCANLNIKVLCRGVAPCMVRIYRRDSEALSKECHLYERLQGGIRVPQVLGRGEVSGFPYALMRFEQGIPLREVVLNHSEKEYVPLMVEAGKALGEFKKYRFSEAGFFDQALDVVEPIDERGWIDYSKDCLMHPVVDQALEAKEKKVLGEVLERHGELWPDMSSPTLVHGDYDPANILVSKQEKGWALRVILDWEFAYSGSYLADVASMLRYRHHLPQSYSDAFLQGVRLGGFSLPEHWPIIVDLFNLLSLLDLLKRSDAKHRPLQYQDVLLLIQEIRERLSEKR